MPCDSLIHCEWFVDGGVGCCEKDIWMAKLAKCLWRDRLWVVYHIANHVHEEKNKKMGTTQSSETFDQWWSAISTCVARTRAGVTARVLSQAPTPHCTELCPCGTVCDSVWQCVTVCDTVQRQSSAFLGASWPPWCCRCSWPPVGSRSTKGELGLFFRFSTCLNFASIFRGIPKTNKQ